jgi:hypothetical protein
MKNPNLKIRYAKGLGDLIACMLHSKLIGWFTHFLTGQNQPCSTCSQRAMALNILFPIPFWKLFFKNIEEMQQSFIEDLKNNGYEVIENKNDKEMTLVQNKVDPLKKIELEKELNKQLEKQISDIKISKQLINSSKTEIGDYIVQVNIFKK